MNEGRPSRRSRKSIPARNASINTPLKDCLNLRSSRNKDSANEGPSSREYFEDIRISSRGSGSRACTSQSSTMPIRPSRMSTPVCRDRSSLGKTHKTKRKLESNRTLSNRSQASDQKYYDPYLEIRKARERLYRYKLKGDWESDEILCKESDRDLERYEEKLKRRYSLKDDYTGDIELERRQTELLRRQRDIDVGKTTDKYAEYILKIPKPERERHHPRTPNKFRVVSRRAWDGMIRKWRRHIHNFENLNCNETWHSLASDVSMSPNSPSSPMHHTGDPAVGRPLGSEEESEAVIESTTLTVDKFSKKSGEQTELETDEDTLQGVKKATRDGPTNPGLSEDETLNPHDVKWNLRGRKVLTETNVCEPEGELSDIHTGLTNDLKYLGVKRDSLKFEDISDMLSPRKRMKTSDSSSLDKKCRISRRKKKQ